MDLFKHVGIQRATPACFSHWGGGNGPGHVSLLRGPSLESQILFEIWDLFDLRARPEEDGQQASHNKQDEVNT